MTQYNASKQIAPFMLTYFCSIKFKRFFLVLKIIIRKHANKSAYLFYGVLGVRTYFFMLQSQHHHSVKGVETSLYFVLIVVSPALSQFDDERQHLIIFTAVKRIFSALQQLCVELDELLHDYLVNLQMPVLTTPLLVHHPDKIAVPVGHLVLLFVRISELIDIFAAYAPEVAAVSPYQPATCKANTRLCFFSLNPVI